MIMRVRLKIRIKDVNFSCEFLLIKIFWLAIIIMAEIHSVSITRGADKES